MATPPFNISTTTPGDSDIVSQFPANERTNRDNLNSWLLTEHNVNGYHEYITMPNRGLAPANPIAGFHRMYFDVNGNLVYLDNAGILYYVGPAPGTLAYHAGSVPAGWVEANGQAITRTFTGAALFTAIGTFYGSGDGSTTFNVPNINGRVIAGRGGTGILDTTGGMSGTSINSTGGAQTNLLVAANIPAGVPSSATNSISVSSARNIPSTAGVVSDQPAPTTAGGHVPATNAGGGDWSGITSMAGNNSISVVSTNAGQTGYKTVQPTITQIVIIKL